MNLSDTMTISEAAKLKGVSIQAIAKAIERGDIQVVQTVAGRRLLSRADVEQYQPHQYPKQKKGEQKP